VSKQNLILEGEISIMNKAGLVTSISEKSGLLKKEAEKALNSFISCIEDAVGQGEKVQLVGFGTFEVKKRVERKGKNPRTLAPIIIPAAKVPVFRAGKSLKVTANK
jgi:DNA-binding protein HU-beta